MNDYLFFIVGMMVGGALGTVFMALLTANREKADQVRIDRKIKYWMNRTKGEKDA